jgi:hypothetical protein
MNEEAVILGLDRRSSEFKIYEFSQVLEATGSFSVENKLGQRGFGPVYKVRGKRKHKPELTRSDKTSQ